MEKEKDMYELRGSGEGYIRLAYTLIHDTKVEYINALRRKAKCQASPVFATPKHLGYRVTSYDDTIRRCEDFFKLEMPYYIGSVSPEEVIAHCKKLAADPKYRNI